MALTRLGLPHAGALQHRSSVQALKELNAGQAVVVEAASQREFFRMHACSPSWG